MAPRSRKRRRSFNEDRRGGCPFTVTTITEQRSNRASKKSKQDDANMEESQRTQLWPFNPEGKFNSMQSMSLPYIVEPRKRWRAMTPYHNFILNGRKYSTHDFVYVANDDSIEAQKIASREEDGGSLPRLTKYWVAKILEIRAADEHHVYARIYWMYSPDELPPNTRYGEESIEVCCGHQKGGAEILGKATENELAHDNQYFVDRLLGKWRHRGKVWFYLRWNDGSYGFEEEVDINEDLRKDFETKAFTGFHEGAHVKRVRVRNGKTSYLTGFLGCMEEWELPVQALHPDLVARHKPTKRGKGKSKRGGRRSR
ncbi:Bromo adjacent region [Metarhizium robertsii ARSEF 23]|uniref:Bromo adjacent region n=1 Tax=Metarhizium robertsii (strain ARSEF 23 / ATCC MYA-3075) TaxID=655844 RepID=E9FCG2_METRA|nr:Bromo adjacent region [Metarhizium robertsii ARSEF 23]EFY94590.2 Bromo adjacent region [Metarhizium robertsii ARSEF 23]